MVRRTQQERLRPTSSRRRRATPWTHRGLQHAFDRAVARAKLPHTRFHDLRHFFITQCFAGGAGGPTVQRLAGHCHLSVTQRYAHTTDALMREAVQVFGRRAG
ncbi:MAG: tyrosine-type recombinase/integrase [Polyangiaceae bacterium]